MLPSLPALRAFDAAARLGSFRAAATHLSVTPTAISHHIRTLEEAFGVRLFERDGRKVRLSGDGIQLAEATGRAFGILETAVDSIRRTSQPVVRLGAGPIFTARWLMPRISDLWERHPTHSLEVVPTFRPRDLKRGTVDIVVRWERLGDMPENAVKLLTLQPAAVASPGFVAKHGPFGQPSDLLRVPILHQRNHWGWRDWFMSQGIKASTGLRGPVFDDANVLLRGAAEGQGAIVGWLPLIDQDLGEGRVVRLFDEEITPTHGYFAEILENTHINREVRIVFDWLISQSAEGKEPIGRPP